MLATHRNRLKSQAPRAVQGCTVARLNSDLMKGSIGFNYSSKLDVSASCVASMTGKR